MPLGFSFDVFLSHNSQDKSRVRRLAELLRAKGLRVWFDEWVIQPGDDIYLTIERGLGSARTLVLCLSSAALKSDWVGLERSTALFRDPSNLQRRFIPLLLDDCELPDALRRYKYVDYRRETETAFAELLAACGDRAVTREDEPSPRLGQTEDAIPAAISALIKLGRELKQQGRYAEARHAFESAREAAEAVNCVAAISDARIEFAETQIFEQRDLTATRNGLLAHLRELSEPTHAKQRQVVLCLIGDSELLLGNVKEAGSLYREARELARKRGDRSGEAHNLIGLSHAEELLGNLGEAHRLLDEATELYRIEHREAAGDERSRTAINLGATFSNKAKLFRHEAKVADAIACLSRAEPLFREANSNDNLGRTLLLKGELLLHEAKKDDGFDALQSALSTFEAIGSVTWQCRCLEDMAKFFAGEGNDPTALKCLGRALQLLGSSDARIESVPYLLKMAHLYCNHDRRKQAKELVDHARDISTKAGDDWLTAECLIVEAKTVQGKDAEAARSDLFRAAVRHVEAALPKSEVKGRRAYFMHKIGELHGWLRNLPEARRWFEQSLREYGEIGDVAGMGRGLASLAAVAREEEQAVDAIETLERVVAFCGDKPLYYDRAGAMHDLGILKLSQGDIEGARRCIDAASDLAEKHNFKDILDVLNESRLRLWHAGRLRQPPHRDFPSLIGELQEWCARYPDTSAAILPLWYYLYSAELWSICRSSLGVKFLIYTEETGAFRRTANALAGHGDLCVWGFSFALKTKPQTDLIPFPMKYLVPPFLKMVKFKEHPSSVEVARKALVGALRNEAYILVPFDEAMEKDPRFGTSLCVFGRYFRLAPRIAKFMLNTPTGELIASKRICLPVGSHEKTPDLLHVMLTGWECGAIPVLLGHLRYGDEIAAVCDSVVNVPSAVSPADGGTAAATKAAWAELLLTCSEKPKEATAAFSKEMAKLASTLSERERMSVRIYAVRFRAGSQEVVHPVAVVIAR
jgi:tetratricopeptide (TPR) repeat protein